MHIRYSKSLKLHVSDTHMCTVCHTLCIHVYMYQIPTCALYAIRCAYMYTCTACIGWQQKKIKCFILKVHTQIASNRLWHWTWLEAAMVTMQKVWLEHLLYMCIYVPEIVGPCSCRNESAQCIKYSKEPLKLLICTYMYISFI